MANEQDKTELSIVILAYKAGIYIEEFVNQLWEEVQLLDCSFEFIIVANYDDENDPTPEIVQEKFGDNERCVIISKRKKGRMGWDMRSGLREAKGEYIAIIDGDGQMPVSDISTVYHLITQNYFDLVFTYRAKRYDGLYRKILSKVYNILFHALFCPSMKLKDINSKPKVVTKKALNEMHLISNDWFTDTEIILEALRNHLRICQVATVFRKNERRKSFVGFSTIFEFVYNLFYYRVIKK